MNAPEHIPERLPKHIPESALDWSEANRRFLVAEFARLRALLEGVDTVAAEAEIAASNAALPAPAAIDVVAERFALSAFERDVLLLATGVEMDARIAILCAEGSGQLQRPWASFGLALAALPDPHWSAVAPSGPLRRWRLVDIDEGAALATSRLKPDERVLHFIGGVNYLDYRLEPLLEPVPAPGLTSAEHWRIAGRAFERLHAATAPLPPVLLDGDDESGKRDVAAIIAARFGVGLYCLRVADVPPSVSEQAALALLWTREAVLLRAGLLLVHEEEDARATTARLVARIDGLTIVTGRAGPNRDKRTLRYTIDHPDLPERRRLWHSAFGDKAVTLAPALETLAAQFRLGARSIGEIAAHADGADSDQIVATLLRRCRDDAAKMPSLARRIESRTGWDDLVLPEAQRLMLHQVALHTRHRIKVHHDWGFCGKDARGLGIATLFWGDSGTGKTLAAEVLANELGLALYRIDLSAVVSKYIGETEKNLRTLFDAAESAGAILLFDEADALFGKRSEVKDSHDRYANIEVSYLLQRMESYSGLTILTTNHKSALDTAFHRRLRFIVHFPFPDQEQREGIWRTAFPPTTPLHDIDYTKLARLNVAGGTIRNIALSAAFLAAEADTPLGMLQLLHGARMEASKRDKQHSDAETRSWT